MQQLLEPISFGFVALRMPVHGCCFPGPFAAGCVKTVYLVEQSREAQDALILQGHETVLFCLKLYGFPQCTPAEVRLLPLCVLQKIPRCL